MRLRNVDRRDLLIHIDGLKNFFDRVDGERYILRGFDMHGTVLQLVVAFEVDADQVVAGRGECRRERSGGIGGGLPGTLCAGCRADGNLRPGDRRAVFILDMSAQVGGGGRYATGEKRRIPELGESRIPLQGATT